MKRSALSRMAAYIGGGSLLFATAVAGAAPAHANDDFTEPVSNLVVVDVDATSATIAWDPPSGAGEDTRYRTELRSGFNRTFQFVDGPEVTFDGLFPGRSYEVRVEVRFVPVTWSEPLEFATADLPLPGTPANVVVTTEPGGATVEWDPVVPDGAEVRDYLVSWTGLGSPVVTTDTSSTRAFAPGADLAVSVTARDVFFRQSEPSDPIAATVPPAEGWEPPTAPTNLRLVADDNGIIQRFEWDAATGGLPPLTYTLIYHFGDMPPSTAGPIAHAGTNTFLSLPSTIGQLTVCAPNTRPADTWIVWIVANSHGVTSPPTGQLVVCF